MQKQCTACGGAIKRKVVPKEYFPVNVLSREEYCATHPWTTVTEKSKVGAFCPWCGHELIELLPKKRSLLHNQDSAPMVASREA